MADSLSSGQFRLGGGIADNGGRSFEAALPSGLLCVAHKETLRGESGGDQHGLCDPLEVGPARGYSDKVAGVSWHVAQQIGLQLRRDGVNLERDEFFSAGKEFADGGSFAGKDGGHRTFQQTGERA